MLLSFKTKFVLLIWNLQAHSVSTHVVQDGYFTQTDSHILYPWNKDTNYFPRALERNETLYVEVSCKTKSLNKSWVWPSFYKQGLYLFFRQIYFRIGTHMGLLQPNITQGLVTSPPDAWILWILWTEWISSLAWMLPQNGFCRSRVWGSPWLEWLQNILGAFWDPALNG